jgi:hypothetical protein
LFDYEFGKLNIGAIEYAELHAREHDGGTVTVALRISQLQRVTAKGGLNGSEKEEGREAG